MAAAEQRTIDESRKELKRMRPRDERADCAGHRQVPDEREAVTGLQRSTSRRRRRALRRRRRRHAPRLERWPLRARKRQRGRTYGAEVEQVVLKVLKVLKVWAGRDVLCAERLTPPRLAPARHDTARLALPEPYRQRLRTTNGVVRLNEEIRRGERVIRIFPSRESALRLLGTLLMEQDEQWSTGKRYFDMTAYWQWRGREAQAAQHAPEGGSPPTT